MDVRTVGPLDGDEGALPIPWERILPYLQLVATSSKGDQIVQYLTTYVKEGERYDPKSSMTSQTFKEIKQWVLQQKQRGKKHPAVLFDYDRTLTRVEGTWFELFDTMDKDGFLLYYMGGEKRLQELRELFTFLVENNVSMFVLTNNGACRKPIFNKVIQYLFQGRPVKIICGEDYKYDKRKAAQDQPELQGVCPQTGATTPVNPIPDFIQDPLFQSDLPAPLAEEELVASNENNENTSEEAFNKALAEYQGGRRKKTKTRRRQKKRKTHKRKSKSKTRS